MTENVESRVRYVPVDAGTEGIDCADPQSLNESGLTV
jgi:hypothetical protein